MRTIILGGGFLGQLLHVFWPHARVFDWRPEAPKVSNRSLGPQYLWEPIAELTCRKFQVTTTVDGEIATDDSIRAYKRKVGKEQDGSDWRAQFQHRMRGYDCVLPPTSDMSVEWGRRITHLQLDGHRLVMADGRIEKFDLLISTVPMPSLLQMAGFSSVVHAFRSRPIYMAVGDMASSQRDMDVNYLSDNTTPIYRQTVRGDKVYTESLEPLPGPNVVKLTPGKIYATDLSHQYCARLGAEGVACFGRYAVWNPEELAHETVRKVREFKQMVGV
jgi:hypothetical protein